MEGPLTTARKNASAGVSVKSRNIVRDQRSVMTKPYTRFRPDFLNVPQSTCPC
jgi:hypothetical protein